MDGTSLIPLETINAVEVFTGAKLDDLLAKIRAETATIVPDVLTAGGRKEIASLAYKVARSKTTIDEAGKTLVAEWKSKSAQVDASRKKARDYLDALRDEIRAPLTEWEAEDARVKQAYIDKAVADLAAREAAIAAKEAEIAAKEKAEVDRIAAEQAAKDRAERDERIRAEAAAKAEQDAAAAIAKAEQERMDAIERSKRQAAEAEERERAAAERAEREKVEAVKQAELRASQEAARVERQRQAQEAAEKAAQEKREANKRHCAKVNNAVMADLVKAGCDEATAKLAVVAIASGNVAHVTINY
jgi:uncharacterized protein YhaN